MRTIIIMTLLASAATAQEIKCPAGQAPVTMTVGSAVICSSTVVGVGCPAPAKETVCVPTAPPRAAPPAVGIGAPPDVSRGNR